MTSPQERAMSQLIIATLDEISRTRTLTEDESQRLENAIRSTESKAPRRKRAS